MIQQAIFLDYGTLDQGDLGLSPLKQTVSQLQLRHQTASEEVVSLASGVEGIITNKVVIDAEILAQLPKLKLICIAATGTNNVDLTAARDAGVTVCNVVGYSTRSVAQHVFTMILALSANLIGYDQLIRDGAWPHSPFFNLLKYPLAELSDQVLGLIGYGAIGKQVASIAQAFGMDVWIAVTAA